MKGRLLAMMMPTSALLLLFAAGCSGDDGGCGALCARTVSFIYAEPVAGHSFEVSFSPHDATVTCELAETGEATCEPNVSSYHLEFSRDGLSSVSWSFAPAGALHIDVTVDERRVTSQTFHYQPGAGDACSSSCPEDPRFQLEQSSQ